MKIIADRQFIALADRDSGAVFQDIEFRDCYFEGCAVSVTSDPSLRSTVKHVRLLNCSQRGCGVYCAAIEDATIDGLNTNGQLLQSWGAVFNRVVLRGRIDRLMLSDAVMPPVLMAEELRQREIARFRSANVAYYENVDWALDISGAEFKECDIRGVPAHLIRRDASTQVVVTRSRASERDWQDLPFNERLIPFSINFFLTRQTDEPATVLIAPKRHPKFSRLLDDLELLRVNGVADPD